MAERGEARGRIVGAASELFYNEGLRAVSVDRVTEHAGTTKVTFYRHFKSKDDLVVAYLEQCAARERDQINDAIAQTSSDGEAAFECFAELFGGFACQPGFRGCPFINAAAEYPDPTSKVRRTVEDHRAWCLAAFELLVRPLGLAAPADVARGLMLLRDGAMVAGYLDRPAVLAASLRRSSRALALAQTG